MSRDLSDYPDPESAKIHLERFELSERLGKQLRALISEDPFVDDRLFSPLVTFDTLDWPRDAAGDLVCSNCCGHGSTTCPETKTLPENTMQCHYCRTTGKLAMQLIDWVRSARLEAKIEYKEKDRYRTFIRASSTCSMCKGNPMKTLGGSDCVECGLPGELPWGG